MKKKLFLLFFLLIFLFIFSFQKQIIINGKIVFFIIEQFAHIPVLQLVTPEPEHRKIEFESINGKVVADLFLPKTNVQKSSIVIAMGVKTAEEDKKLLLSLAETLSRLGYVVLWPRLEMLDKGQPLVEEPETFIRSFEYLEDLREADKDRVSFVGFSVGSSIALVAAEDERISNKVRSLVFFGGYFNIFEYFESLETKTSVFNSKKVSWEPDKGTSNHINEILGNLEISMSEALESERLVRYNPSENIENFKARIFILHDKNDSFVHYFESEKLNRALEGQVSKDFFIINLFDHVRPKGAFSTEAFGEFIKFHGFLYKVLEYL